MEIVVQKYGGSSVADNNKLYNVCKRIIQAKEQNKSVVVVVSAQGKMTDNLVKERKEITTKCNPREQDVLLSVGEQITISKLVMCLEKLNYKAISFLGWQVPIITDSNFGDANIINIDVNNIIKELKEDKIVVVAGFQGIDKNNNITTLGRGGSDTTAIALAGALNIKECEIYKDVDGVYSEDPNKNKNAIKYDKVPYNKMIEMAENGAKVLHDKCVKMAKEKNVKIIVKSTFDLESKGTIICD